MPTVALQVARLLERARELGELLEVVDCVIAGEVAELAAAQLGRAFKPDRVVFVPALPKTRSAKIVRRAVRAKALGKDPGDLSSVENPEALEDIARAV